MKRSENIRLSKIHPGHFLVDLQCLWIIRGAVHQVQRFWSISLKADSARKEMKNIAYLTELDMFYDPFRVKDMIHFYETQFSDFRINKAWDLLKDMKIDRDKKIGKLSKGNRGRLKLALTLARDAAVVLLDEPFSGLDPMVRESIVKSLLTYLELDKQTIVIATHEIHEIEQILDEVVVVLNGRIEEKKDVEQLREESGMSLLEWLKRFIEEKD
ncbi:hypothetical protein BLMD_05170 [Bacillus paralicheniformis]|jgi:ABC-2 type transport system ATP-binding protein|nr:MULTISPECIES: ATP-binding cassette domain-containing protein [Bacillus]AGN35442.1 putative ABC transporter ATP-binding protein YhcG [Bacillus paralicheniformis ATCC 9945a]ARA84866.1 hypothetical protein BLMD_05170 [Bacillus paralicheniformis]AYQ15533.1 ATP-binding cassette domain-containing protein [Bacillus paralicheniformis]MDR4214248.1 AAA family ATPase [Bacillus paralicheniformis]OCI06199.1 hypothetical protein BBP22_03755 [Bacillus paralicheniformis]